MGNSSSICSDRNAIRNFDENGTPIYPTANNSCSPSNGQVTPYDQQQIQQQQQRQIYKTTIPVNEQNSCQCGGAFDRSAVGAQLSVSPNLANNHDAINVTQRAIGIPTNASRQQQAQCCHSAANSNTNTAADPTAVGSSQANKNHTTTTTTTTIEYELSNGIAKLSKISTSRVAAEQSSLQLVSQLSAPSSETPHPQAPRSQLPPLLSSAELENLSQSVEALNRYNLTHASASASASGRILSNYQQQRSLHHTMTSNAKCSEDLRFDKTRCLTRDTMGIRGTAGESDTPGNITGLDRLYKKKFNKGLAFTLEERQLLGIQGLLPAVVKSEEEQLQHALQLLDRLPSDLDKYMYLIDLSERNERLFYRVLTSNVAKMMPLVYTPTVGLACQKFSLVYKYPKGMFITIKDKNHVYDVLKNWPEHDVRAIVVTDGERILGLGDLGANGMGIPVGKLSLYTALAGIQPSQCLPITLDVGTNTQSLLDDPLYIGLRQKRVTGPDYDEFIDEFMHAVVRRYGQNCLIQFEDFGNANAFRLLAKYRDTHCTFNDDIQGTASVAVAGLLASLKLKNTQLRENVIMFQGAGEAALGIANLCMITLKKEGLSENDAKKHIWMVDSKGLIVKDRPAGGISSHKARFAQNCDPIDTLAEAVRFVKPTVLIGAAAIGGAFTPEILRNMGEYNESPIIFALSNPTSKAECTAEEAYTNTNGRCIFASGSPFPPVQYEGKTFYPGQGNNSYIFPGVALGVLCAGMLTIPEEVFLIAAEKLACLVSSEDLAKGSLYPPLKNITGCSVEIAIAVMEYAYKSKLATLFPEPSNKCEFIKSQMYNSSYLPVLPEVYSWSNKL